MNRPRRKATLALWIVVGIVPGACSSGNAPAMEMDLAELALASETQPLSPIPLSDGSVVIAPGRSERAALVRRRVERGPESIAELLRLAEENPRLAPAALRIIADILLAAHPGAFSIPRAGPDREYWVIRWPTGEGLIVMDPKDLMNEREQALRAFRTWLWAHGYLVERKP